MNCQKKYEYTRRFGKAYHNWIVVGARIGVNLHITDLGEKDAKEFNCDRYSGGIEVHYRSPSDYMKDDAPSHNHCWVLECPCWHDGSSMQATEFWVPFWLSNPHDHDRMFVALENRLRELDEDQAPASIVAEVCKAREVGK